MQLHLASFQRIKFRRGASLADRSYDLPRWATDGGNGSVVSVVYMNNEDYRLAWHLLRSNVKALGGYSVDLEVISEWMDSIEGAIQDR
jgi:hypothetical protein